MNLTNLLKALCIALVLVFGGSLANGPSQASPTPGPTPTRDWVNHPAVVQLDWPHQIFAIGDVHADPERLIGVLKAAGIISPETPVNVDPRDLKWTYKPKFTGVRSVLVMTGDMIDKGPTPGAGSLRVIAILRALQASAVASGDQVIILMGNHEAEFLADPNGSKTADFKNELRTANIDPAKVANCEGDLGQFLCNLPIAAKVQDWFFCHAGDTDGRTIAALSAAIETGFASQGFATPELIGANSILEARLNAKNNRVIWINKLFNGAKNPQALLADYANKLGVKHIVQGHQPGTVDFGNGGTREEDAVFQGYGLLFLIDTGMSRGVDGNKSAGGAIRIDFKYSIDLNSINTGKSRGVDGSKSAGGARRINFQYSIDEPGNPVTDDTEATVICANGPETRLWKNSVRNPNFVSQKCGIR